MGFFHYLRKRSRSMKGLHQALWRLFAPSLTCPTEGSKAFGRFGGDNLPNVRDLRPIGARSYNIYILSEASESTEFIKGIRIQGRGAFEASREYAFRNDRV